MSDELPDHDRVRAIIAELDRVQQESERIRAHIAKIRRDSPEYPDRRAVFHRITNTPDPPEDQSSQRQGICIFGNDCALARHIPPTVPPPRESRDQREERDARIAEMMRRAQRHRAEADSHIEHAKRFTERAEALKANPPNRQRR